VTTAASSRASFSDRHSDAPRQKETAAATAVAAEKIAIAAIVFLLAESPRLVRALRAELTHAGL